MHPVVPGRQTDIADMDRAEGGIIASLQQEFLRRGSEYHPGVHPGDDFSSGGSHLFRPGAGGHFSLEQVRNSILIKHRGTTRV